MKNQFIDLKAGATPVQPRRSTQGAVTGEKTEKNFSVRFYGVLDKEGMVLSSFWVLIG
jgi:hypothetical protein